MKLLTNVQRAQLNENGSLQSTISDILISRNFPECQILLSKVLESCDFSFLRSKYVNVGPANAAMCVYQNTSTNNFNFQSSFSLTFATRTAPFRRKAKLPPYAAR